MEHVDRGSFDLAEVQRIAGGLVRRPGQFRSLGLLCQEFPEQFVFAETPEFLGRACAHPTAVTVATTPELASSVPSRMGLIEADDPRHLYYSFHEHLCETGGYGASVPTTVAPTAMIHPMAYVAPWDVRIDSGVMVEPGAVILEGSILEEASVVRAGTVVSGAGFMFYRRGNTLIPVSHAGVCRLGPGSEVQHNSHIGRALFGDGVTVLEGMAKVDTLVHIAHDARIGARSCIVAGAVICGFADIGPDVWVGPQAIVTSECRVGAGARISLGSVVTKNVGPGERMTGNFAVDHTIFLRFIKALAAGKIALE